MRIVGNLNSFPYVGDAGSDLASECLVQTFLVGGVAGQVAYTMTHSFGLT
jgi:hypothetical protein